MRVVVRELQRFFAEPLPKALDVAETLGAHIFEVEEVAGEGEWATVTVDVLPNRGADALSHRGIARELSAILRRPLAYDPLAAPEPSWHQQEGGLGLSFAPQAPCERYIAVLVEGVSVRPSPQWVQQTLISLGLRPINNVVDATNLAMLRLGQPLHAFDADKLTKTTRGSVALGVRLSRDGEALVLLGGQEVRLSEGLPVVVDAVADVPIALAGVKGGASAEVTADTTRIVLESAHFPAPLIRQSVRHLGVTTDAAQRFQHNPSVRLAAYGMAEVLELVREFAGGEMRAVAQWYPAPEPEPESVVVPLGDFRALSGRDISQTEVMEALERLGCAVSVAARQGETTLTVVPPWERRDLAIAPDIVEEVVRLTGYAALPAQGLPPAPAPLADPLQYAADSVRELLAREGFTELRTYMLRAEGEVCLANALAADKGCLRRDIATGLQEALIRNEPFAPLAGGDTLLVFEIGEVVRKEDAASPPWREEVRLTLGALAQGKKVRARARESLARAREAVEALLGALAWEESEAPETLLLEARIDEAALRLAPKGPYNKNLWNPEARYAPPVPYPVVVRDIAAWAPEGIGEGEMRQVLWDAVGEIARRVDCIDRYEKDGSRSFAFRLVLQASDRTLSDEEANNIARKAAHALQHIGCELR
ncbi:hypothetical protein D6792_03755 [Candidatus Parcubacteria bacterium]|nr:MAG: hypothetical protein D6792_03755 [Candidatus Parcubacteria bacterium]